MKLHSESTSENISIAITLLGTNLPVRERKREREKKNVPPGTIIPNPRAS